MPPRIKRRCIISGVHALNVVTCEGNEVVNINRLQEWENVVKVFRAHSLAMAKTPQLECRSSGMIAEVNALFSRSRHE
jgi:hypothetical protein